MMSADSSRKSVRYSCCVVRPQPYSDKSVVDSVYNFISSVPQSYSSAQKLEERDKLLWAKFVECDVNDPCCNPNLYGHADRGTAPLLLALGYHNGVQVWHLTYQGEAMEILSLRQGPVSIFTILPSPSPCMDGFSSVRPLVAIGDSSSSEGHAVRFVSLRSGDEVSRATFRTLHICGIKANRHYVVLIFPEKLAIFGADRLKQLCWIGGCYPCPGINKNPIALGTHLLAFADKKLVALHQSGGGMSCDGSQSYAATVISAAKGALKGLTMFSGAVVHRVTGSGRPQLSSHTNLDLSASEEDHHRPGIVSVVDLNAITGTMSNMWLVTDDPDLHGLMTHFHAHANEPVAAMEFDASGMLLLTCCILGHNFHIFRLVTHPCCSSLAAVHHLYTVHRGDTTAKIVNISFTKDSRWGAVSTHRGTTHVFPITPYGGPVNVRTHCQTRVVNRVSRFHKSAGLDDLERAGTGRRSPIFSSGSPGSSGIMEYCPSLIRQNALNYNMGNPRLPPFPHPTTVHPLAQLKSQDIIAGFGSGIGSAACPSLPAHGSTLAESLFNTTSVFAAPRLWLTSAVHSADRSVAGTKRQMTEMLFVVNQDGTLVQYSLEPRPKVVACPMEKVSEDAPVELVVTGQLQWMLSRSKTSPEVSIPLPCNSPLILATDAVLSQQATTGMDAAEPGPVTRYDSKDSLSSDHSCRGDDQPEKWVSQVEIVTHAGPHRRLWMGPQFSFKTYHSNTTLLHASSPSLFSHCPEMVTPTSMDILTDQCDLESLPLQPSRSNPVSMPLTRPAYRRSSASEQMSSPGRSTATFLIEAGSYDQSPNLNDVMCRWAESSIMHQPMGCSEEADSKLRSSIAEAMVDICCSTSVCMHSSSRLEVEQFHDSNETLSTSSESSSSHAHRTSSDINLDTVFPSTCRDSPVLLDKYLQ